MPLANARSSALRRTQPARNSLPGQRHSFPQFRIPISEFRISPGVRPGFTVMELLVVISVIGMLVGLLMPAIQAARESGRKSQCANNLRQLGLAIQNFHSNNGYLPSSTRPAAITTQPRIA